MKTISFNLNWNAKLYCNCFTTIRPKNDDKYQLAEVYEIMLKGKNLGEATIVFIKDLKLSQITQAMSFLDTGFPASKAIEIFRDLYPDIENIEDQTFTYMVLERVIKDINHNNQIDENRNTKPTAIQVPG